jgi:hypothetical protein
MSASDGLFFFKQDGTRGKNNLLSILNRQKFGLCFYFTEIHAKSTSLEGFKTSAW